MRQVRKIIRNRRAIIWSKKISLFDGGKQNWYSPNFKMVAVTMGVTIFCEYSSN